MGDTFVGEIKPFAGSYVPAGWIECDGRQLQIQQYQLLFAIITTQFGGNIQQGYFNVPDLRGRVTVGAGQGTGLSPWTVNTKAGAESVTLTPSQIPSHHHTIFTNFGPYATNAASFTNTPVATSSYVSRYVVPTSPTTATAYAAYGPAGAVTNAVTMAPGLLAVTGETKPHENRQPVLAVRFAINATAGVYPDYN